MFGDGGGLLAVVRWHEWVNHSNCCPGSRPQHRAPNGTVGDRRRFTGPARNIFSLSLDVISPSYKYTASLPVRTTFHWIGGCKMVPETANDYLLLLLLH